MTTEKSALHVLLDEIFDVTDRDIVISRQKKWSNQLQKRIDVYEYQVFTMWNCCCMPAESIEEALKNAKERYKVKPIENCCKSHDL